MYVKMKLRTGEEEEAAAIFNEQKKVPTDAYYGNTRDIPIYIICTGIKESRVGEGLGGSGGKLFTRTNDWLCKFCSGSPLKGDIRLVTSPISCRSPLQALCERKGQAQA